MILIKRALITLLSITLLISCNNNHTYSINKSFDEDDENEKFDENEERYKQQFEDFKDPNLGYVPTDVLFAATALQ